MKIYKQSPGVGYLDTRYVNVTGDTMTGDLVMSGANIDLGTGLLVGAGGTTGISIDANGYVSVGTYSKAGENQLKILSAATYDGLIRFGEATDYYGWTIRYDGSNTNDLYFTRHENDQTGSTMVAFDRSTGYVGIGIVNPDAMVHVSSSTVGDYTSPRIIFENSNFPRNNFVGLSGDADNLVIAADEDNLGGSSNIQFRVDAGEKMRLTSDGNLGIGTDSPTTFKLQVAGSVGPNADSSYTLGGTSNYWSNFYADTHYFNSTAFLDGATAGRLAMTGYLYGTGGMYVKNGYYAMLGQANLDYSMIGLYDRSEIVLADKKGSITVALTGAGTAASTYTELVDGSGDFYSITGTDNTTTQIQITVDMGANQANYSDAYWQPFVHYRLKMGGAFNGTWYKNIVVEVASQGAPTTWVKPSNETWETTDASASEAATGVQGLWIGARGNPSISGNVWRYVRFTLTDRQENAGYAFKDRVWIAEIGLRHASAPFTKLYLSAGGDTTYGNIKYIDNAKALFGTGSDSSIYYDGSDMYIEPREVGTGDLILANGGGNVGIGTTEPNSKLHTAGSFAGALETVTSASDTLDSTNHVVLCDCTSNAITINLPTASGITGRMYHIKKIDSTGNTVTVDGNSTETIDGETTQVIDTQWDSIMVVSNGSNWLII